MDEEKKKPSDFSKCHFDSWVRVSDGYSVTESDEEWTSLSKPVMIPEPTTSEKVPETSSSKPVKIPDPTSLEPEWLPGPSALSQVATIPEPTTSGKFPETKFFIPINIPDSTSPESEWLPGPSASSQVAMVPEPVSPETLLEQTCPKNGSIRVSSPEKRPEKNPETISSGEPKKSFHIDYDSFWATPPTKPSDDPNNSIRRFNTWGTMEKSSTGEMDEEDADDPSVQNTPRFSTYWREESSAGPSGVPKIDPFGSERRSASVDDEDLQKTEPTGNFNLFNPFDISYKYSRPAEEKKNVRQQFDDVEDETTESVPRFDTFKPSSTTVEPVEEFQKQSQSQSTQYVPPASTGGVYRACLPSRAGNPVGDSKKKKDKKKKSVPIWEPSDGVDTLSNIGVWKDPATVSRWMPPVDSVESPDANYGVWGAPSSSEAPRAVNVPVTAPKGRSMRGNWRVKNTDLSYKIGVKCEWEYQENAFSRYYPRDSATKKPMKVNSKRIAVKELKNYKHWDAIEFAATSWFWSAPPGSRLPAVEGNWALPTYDIEEEGVRAYYRVVAEKSDKYILMACHANVHAFHRADLRFVELNDRAILKGFDKRNVIGHMFLGDLVAVTELARTKYPHAFRRNIKSVTQDTPCTWMVRTLTLLHRQLDYKLSFSFLSNGMGVVKGYDEAMNVLVTSRDDIQLDKLFMGDAFVPDRSDLDYCQDHTRKQQKAVALMAADMPAYPNALPTIYSFVESPDDNRLFEIGTDAFQMEIGKSQREKAVETCVLMGCAAANAVFNGRFDCRAFTLENAERDRQILRFSIEDPPKQPTLGRWSANNKIIVRGPNYEVNATIESVIADPGKLRIVARLARTRNQYVDFRDEGFIVCQREPMDFSVLRDGFFSVMKKDSNARRVIETLYGGDPIKMRPFEKGTFTFPSTPPIELNEFQNEYVSMILARPPLVLGSSPFGCGKSMTIVTAAFEIHKQHQEESELRNDHQQLLITQSNYASVNLIDIAHKAHLISDEVKFVRYVSDRNWKELPDECRTDYDMPILMEGEFLRWATGAADARRARKLDMSHFRSMINFLLDIDSTKSEQFTGTARAVFDAAFDRKKPVNREILDAFFILYQPDIIMVTADSSLQLLAARVLKDVVTIQIDEASQLPEYTLFCLLVSFPNACFGLIGDIHQLPPYCVDELRGRLRDYGIGNTMERVVQNELFPRAILKFVYRCHPVTTQLLSDLFYDGDLLSGVTEDDRNAFMRYRPDFWPNPKFPMIIVDNKQFCYSMGTSKANYGEAELAQQIVRFITSPSVEHTFTVAPKDIGVISFYSAQTSVLTERLRGSGVKCGTVDAFQGSEREVIILCCTNENLTEFMQLSNRLNVALSRARQATIVIGDLDGLRKAKYWSTIVQRAEENDCLVDTAKYPFCL